MMSEGCELQREGIKRLRSGAETSTQKQEDIAS